MILETLRAAIIGGIPVAVFTFLAVQWTIASGRMERFSDARELSDQHYRRVKQGRKHRPEDEDRRLGDLVQDKLLSFGGGYYGTMAALTYVLIETVEVGQFILNLFDPDTWLNRLGIDLLIDFVVNSLMNLVYAFTWFSTLPGYITINNGWIWLVVSYGAYWLALRFTIHRGDEAWARLGAFFRERVWRRWLGR